MSNNPNPLKRFLIWLSGAPTRPTEEPSPGPARDTGATPALPADGPSQESPVGAAELPPADLGIGQLEPEVSATPEPVVEAIVTEPPVEAKHSAPAMSSAALAGALRAGSEEPTNDAVTYGVAIEPVDLPQGTAYWRVIRVHHLTPEENQGKHHIYLDVLDEAGQRVMGAQARVTWEGGEQVITVDKPASEPGSNFPLWKWQVASVEMLGLPSDRVTNLHTAHPDEPPGTGNTLFHHSFQVDFQRALKGAATGAGNSVIRGLVANGARRRLLLLRDGEAVATTETDAQGAYRFEKLEAGTYVVAVEGTEVHSDPIAVDGTADITANLELPDGFPTPSGKVLEHYVLFGPPTSARTAVHLALATAYVKSKSPAFGYRPADARRAENVILAGSLEDISQATEDELMAAGCQVQRIQGTAEQIAAAYQQLMGVPREVFLPGVAM